MMRLTPTLALFGVAVLVACGDPEETARSAENAESVEVERPLVAGEGTADVTGGKVWYRIVGSGTATPVILLHGGPGGSSNYLNPLTALAEERPVVFYDQLGAGRSDHVADTTLFTIDRVVDELETLRTFLGVGRFHLYGHSSGSVLAVGYYLRHPNDVVSLVLAGPVLSIPRFDITDRLDEIRVPTLFLAGELDEEIPASAQYYQTLVPGAEVVIIPDAAHFSIQDNPEAEVEAVRAFLRRVDERSSR